MKSATPCMLLLLVVPSFGFALRGRSGETSPQERGGYSPSSSSSSRSSTNFCADDSQCPEGHCFKFVGGLSMCREQCPAGWVCSRDHPSQQQPLYPRNPRPGCDEAPVDAPFDGSNDAPADFPDNTGTWWHQGGRPGAGFPPAFPWQDATGAPVTPAPVTLQPATNAPDTATEDAGSSRGWMWGGWTWGQSSTSMPAPVPTSVGQRATGSCAGGKYEGCGSCWRSRAEAALCGITGHR